MRTEIFRILRRSPKFLFGITVLIVIIVGVWLYPIIDKRDPVDMVTRAFQHPSEKLPLGSDNFGRNVFIELMYGTRTSLFVGLLSGTIATCIGLLVGFSAGFIGGRTDNILTALTNMFIVIPSFIILILISVSINTRSAFLVAAIIGCTSWPWTARAVRAQTTSLRQRDHVNIARISGYSTVHIVISEVFPYLASYVVMAFILQTASGILQEASISMLGLGPFNTISLGTIMNWALRFEAPTAGAWWAFIPPSLVIASITFSLFMMNSGMDEVFNPKIRS
jgi:peptide/nickel transport system permease protein